MNDFIRELCKSEISGVGNIYRLSEEADRCIAKHEQILAELKKRLDGEEKKLLDEYVYCTEVITEEAENHAFSCGIKFIVQVIGGVYED